jgi:putative membrane protein
MSDNPSSAPRRALDQMDLAHQQTFLAYERTLMAWVRTATSLIAFGFTAYKFFFFMKGQGLVPMGHQVVDARTFGLAMMAVGVVTLSLATVQYRVSIQRLRDWGIPMPWSVALLLAAIVAFLGTAGFLIALLRW